MWLQKLACGAIGKCRCASRAIYLIKALGSIGSASCWCPLILDFPMTGCPLPAQLCLWYSELARVPKTSSVGGCAPRLCRGGGACLAMEVKTLEAALKHLGTCWSGLAASSWALVMVCGLTPAAFPHVRSSRLGSQLCFGGCIGLIHPCMGSSRRNCPELPFQADRLMHSPTLQLHPAKHRDLPEPANYLDHLTSQEFG